jgi:hypothetical protein
MKRILSLALAATTLVGLGACGSDSKLPSSDANIPSDLSLPSDLSIPDLSIPDLSIPDLSIPSDISLPAMLTGDCKAIYAQMIGAMAQAFAPAGEEVDVEKIFGDVSANVPDELQGDVATMATAMQQLGEVMKQYDNDMTNPEVAKALQELSTPEVQAASEHLNAYFETTCPQS